MADLSKNPLLIKNRTFIISDVYFQFGKNQDGTPNSKRYVSMRYLDYNKGNGYSMELEALKKDPNFAKLDEEQIKDRLLGQRLTLTVSLLV